MHDVRECVGMFWHVSMRVCWHVLACLVCPCGRLFLSARPSETRDACEPGGIHQCVCVCLPITDHRSSTDDLSWITHPDHPPIIDPPIILRSSIIDHLSPTDHRFTDHHITTPTYVAPELSRHMTMVYIYSQSLSIRKQQAQGVPGGGGGFSFFSCLRIRASSFKQVLHFRL